MAPSQVGGRALLCLCGTCGGRGGLLSGFAWAFSPEGSGGVTV